MTAQKLAVARQMLAAGKPKAVIDSGHGRRFWNTFGDQPACARQAGLRIRLRSRSNLARPYIWRLIVFTVHGALNGP
jgi:hypothetical protein